MLADAAGASENADEADLLNSESEHSEEEELNPDDFSEDVSHNICCNGFFPLVWCRTGSSATCFIQQICSAVSAKTIKIESS